MPTELRGVVRRIPRRPVPLQRLLLMFGALRRADAIRATTSESWTFLNVRRLAETWVEVTPKRLRAMHEAGLPA